MAGQECISADLHGLGAEATNDWIRPMPYSDDINAALSETKSAATRC